MIGYTMVGTHDLKAAGNFYDKVLGVLGAKRSLEGDTFIVRALRLINHHSPSAFPLMGRNRVLVMEL